MPNPLRHVAMRLDFRSDAVILVRSTRTTGRQIDYSEWVSVNRQRNSGEALLLFAVALLLLWIVVDGAHRLYWH
jgi:hypothetical protein